MTDKSIDTMVAEVEERLSTKIDNLADQVGAIKKEIQALNGELSLNRTRGNNKPFGVMSQSELSECWLEYYQRSEYMKVLEERTGYKSNHHEKMPTLLELYIKKARLQVEINELLEKRNKASEMYSDEAKKRAFLVDLLAE